MEDSSSGQCVKCLLQLALGEAGVSEPPTATGLTALAGPAGAPIAEESFPSLDNYTLYHRDLMPDEIRAIYQTGVTAGPQPADPVARPPEKPTPRFHEGRR